MAGLAFPSADAPGAAPAVDRSSHLLLVPHTADGQAALARSDARVIARYGEFTLTEASGTDDERLREAGADRRDDMREVGLPDAEIDPLTQRASLAAKSAPDREEVLAVVQFVGPVKEEWLGRLKATGAQVVQYVPENGYLVLGSGVEVDRLAGLVGTDTAVRAVTPVTAGDKVHAALTAGGVRGVAVQTVAGEAGATARRAGRRSGRELAPTSAVGLLRTQFLALGGASVEALAADPGVVSITPWSAPELHDERAAQIVAGNVTDSGLPNGPGYLGWLTSEEFDGSLFDFAIDITDSGLDTGQTAPGHPDFYVGGVKPGPDRVSYLTDYTTDAGAEDCVGHGTNVASIAGGFGEGSSSQERDSEQFQYGMGIAPRALIGSSKIFDCNFSFSTNRTYKQIAENAYVRGARISNSSWGISAARGAYTADAQVYDGIVRDADPDLAGNQELVQVFAAGNERVSGSITSPGTAKNVITVGASEGVRAVPGADGCNVGDAEANHAGHLMDFSSRGPTSDLRLKPDVVAPGSHVTGAAPQHSGYTGNDRVLVCNRTFPSGNLFYSLSSGTSQAAPQVAGAAALIREWFQRERGDPPSPAMTKAILTNTATDLVAGDDGTGAEIGPAPNNDQGWGRVNLGSAFDSSERVYHDQLRGAANLIERTGDSWSGSFAPTDADAPLEVTLVWTDPPGPVGGNASVNNLDLVVDAGGEPYKGNVFDDGESVPGGTADSRNNVETVFLPDPGSGAFEVRVVGTTVAGDGVPQLGDALDQDYALVVSNAEGQGAPVLEHESSAVSDGAGGDGDGALEPGESFTLDEKVRNTGTATASGVSGTLSADQGLSVIEDAATWPPTIKAGAAASSTTDAVAQVQDGAPCGADAIGTMTLTAQGAPGSQEIPITLPTGAPQIATANSRGHSPALAIPDNSAVGATSSMSVTRPGHIKDLNVRIGALVHPQIGDLRIDVVGPDGTTVTLADRPGGPDNQGDNMVGTVFDDEESTNIANGRAPYSGRFTPHGDQLSRFDGKQRQGEWKLRVWDLSAGDTGHLVSWGTEMSRPACDFGRVPFPPTIQSGPSSPTTQTSARFTFGGGSAGGSYECRLDGNLFSECASGQSYSGLSPGSHTFWVRAVDATGNVDATPATRTWTVRAAPKPPSPPSPPPANPSAPAAPADTTPPDFALVPTAHSWKDALAGRMKLLAGCASACRVSAKLSVSRATARRLGLKRTLGRASARLTGVGVKFVRIRLAPGAREVARRGVAVKARLAATVSAGRSTAALSSSITVRSGGGLGSLASRGLRLAGDCSERCSTRSQVVISAGEARRLGLKASGGPFMAAQGSSVMSDRPFTMTLRAGRTYRRALARAAGLNATLTALVRGATGPSAQATSGLKLRR